MKSLDFCELAFGIFVHSPFSPLLMGMLREIHSKVEPSCDWLVLGSPGPKPPCQPVTTGSDQSPIGLGICATRKCSATTVQITGPLSAKPLQHRGTISGLTWLPLTFTVYPDGRVCISILHAPGDDPMGYESSAERWSPVQSVEKILLSVVSMLAGEL